MKRWLVFVIAIFSLSLFACGGSGGGGSESNADNLGTLRIHVTDAPFPFKYVKSASIVIQQVWIRHADGSGFEEKLLKEPKEIDLVPLTGGVSEALVEAKIPVGTYDQARLIVDAGSVVLTDDAFVHDEHTFSTKLGNMKSPSGSQSGIKVNIEPVIEVVTRLSDDLTLDFDLTKSFVFNGPPTHRPGVKRVLFTPVVRAVNNSVFGRITLKILGDNATPSFTGDDTVLPDVTVRALDQNGADVAATKTNDSGSAWIQLLPGTYDIKIEDSEYDTIILEDIEVYLANETALGEITLAATWGQVSGVVKGDSGTALDESDDIMLGGVTVTIFLTGESEPLILNLPELNPQLTDAQGAYRFDKLDPGDYDLTFEKEGFESGELIAVPAVKIGFAPTVTLTETHGRITLTVMGDNGTELDSTDDTVITGATVKVFDGIVTLIDTRITDETGNAEFLLLPGEYTVHIEADDHNSKEVFNVEVLISNVTDLGVVTLEKIPSP
jgi:hypothetical protein